MTVIDNINPDQLGDTVLLPDYCVEVAELLATTEGHTDPTVRAIRKIVTQAAVALRAAHDGIGVTYVDPTPSDPAPGATAPSTATPPTPQAGSEAHTNNHLGIRQRLLLLGVDQGTVRQWAAANDVPFNKQGTIRTDVLDAYETANPVGAS